MSDSLVPCPEIGLSTLSDPCPGRQTPCPHRNGGRESDGRADRGRSGCIFPPGGRLDVTRQCYAWHDIDAPRQRSGGARASSAASTWLSARRSASGTRAGCRRRACARVEDLGRPAAERDPAPRSPSSAWPARSTPGPARSISSHDASAGHALPASFLAVVRVPLPVWAARPLPRTARQRQARTARDFSRRWTEGRANVSARPPVRHMGRLPEVVRSAWPMVALESGGPVVHEPLPTSAAAARSPTRCASAARRGAWDWPLGTLGVAVERVSRSRTGQRPGDRRAARRVGFPPCRPAGGDRGVQQGRRGSHGPTTARLFSAAEPR